MLLKKNIVLGKINKFCFYFLILFFIYYPAYSSDDLEGQFLNIKILDKVSSKDQILKLKIGQDKKFKNLIIKALKCKNSEFDDNPEIIAYLQVKDLVEDNNDKVFVFNGWSFSSSPSLNPFDHPVYDLWITRCYN
tara:strand:- start:278 stop:682 length:405 start_codon:yes stop_codon:yes gene_type:complete